MNVLDAVDAASLRKGIINFRSGDEIKVHVRVIEGSKSRIQVFQGVIIRRQGAGVRETFTIRKLSYGVGVERTFPVHTPVIEKFEMVRRGDVRRAKLYYLRDLRGKAAKIKERRGANNEFIVEDVIDIEDVLIEETIIETTTEETAIDAGVETVAVAEVEETEAVAEVEETEAVAEVEETEAVAEVEETEAVAEVEETEAVAEVEATEAVAEVEETEAVAEVEEVAEEPDSDSPPANERA